MLIKVRDKKLKDFKGVILFYLNDERFAALVEPIKSEIDYAFTSNVFTVAEIKLKYRLEEIGAFDTLVYIENRFVYVKGRFYNIEKRSPIIKLKDPEFVSDWILQKTEEFSKEHSIDTEVLLEYSKIFQHPLENLLREKRDLENSYIEITNQTPIDVLNDIKYMVEENLVNDCYGNKMMFPSKVALDKLRRLK